MSSRRQQIASDSYSSSFNWNTEEPFLEDDTPTSESRPSSDRSLMTEASSASVSSSGGFFSSMASALPFGLSAASSSPSSSTGTPSNTNMHIVADTTPESPTTAGYTAYPKARSMLSPANLRRGKYSANAKKDD